MTDLSGRDNRDPRGILASAETLGRIEAVCRRRFRNQADADECYVFILEGLAADDYKRLRSFQGRSSYTTYVYTVVNSLASDFSRHKYGRKRIPKQVTCLGPLAEVVYRLVCWQRMNFREAYEVVCCQGLFTGGYGVFLECLEELRQAPCQENPRFVSVDDENSPAHDLADPGSNPLEALLLKLDEERRRIATEVLRHLTDELDPAERLLVQMVYGTDKPVTAAAKAAGFTLAAARKRLESILTRLRAGLLARGIRND